MTDWENYRPTERELSIERQLQAWAGMLRPWQAKLVLEGANKRFVGDETAKYHELHEVPNGR